MFNLTMTYAVDPSQLNIGSPTDFLVGSSSDLRGDYSRQLGVHSNAHIIQLIYSSSTLTYKFNDQDYSIDDLDVLVACISKGLTLLDATTLGFVEICLCLRALKEFGSGELRLLYAEPKGYQHSIRSRGVLHNRDFALSDMSHPFMAVPGSTILMNRSKSSKALIIVGYEGDRLQQFIEQNALSGHDCHVLFGVPAFYPGWESNSFANTVSELNERQISSVFFAGATNPLAAYEMINSIHTTLQIDERLIIAPIGTKPHGIGAALYACFNDNVGLVYDHPQKTKGRTDGIGKWHLYEITI